MASCPICHKQVEIKSQHHGALYNCPHCQGSYFIDWNGNPEPPPPQEELPADFGMPLQPPPSTPAEPSVTEEIPAESGGADADSFAPLQPNEAAAFAPSDDAYPPASDSYPSPSPGTAETQIGSWTPPESADQFAAPEGSAAGEPAPVPKWDAPPGGLDPVEDADEGDLGEVAVYGNSSTPAGPLSYGIVIEGIELAETFSQLRDAITDSRFAWDADKVMKSIKSGRLELKGMNATKAALLVHRLKYLPVEISWSQEIYAASLEADPS